VAIDDRATSGRGPPHHGPGREAAREEAPSNLAIIGRYILTPDIFPALEATAERSDRRDSADQRTAPLLKDRRLYACEIKGVRHDTGNKLGFLKALVYFALRRPDLAGRFREYLDTLAKPALSDSSRS
jgi:UTP--glucose-1-phosphate uridylyltransferase